VKRATAAPLALLFLAACGGGQGTPSTPAPAASSPESQASAESGASPLAKASVTLYFPSAAGDTLEAETREIVDTKRPADRGAQILAALLEGPQSKAALPAVPSGTTLRKLWVRDDGNAYADFSEELASGLTGGSADEILTVYAIVDSLTSNIPSIRRVGILVAGRERETLGGHLDVRRPLPPDPSLAPQAKAAP
jgi:spore germination protein GerM